MIKRLVVFFSVISIAFILTSCIKDKNIVSIEIENLPTEGIYIEDFKIEDLNIIINYNDNIKKTLALTLEMIEEESYQKLLIPGEHTIYFSYEGYLGKFIILLLDNVPESKIIYYLAQMANATELSYEEWLETIKGEDGREVMFRVTSTHIQWQYQGETSWNDLIELSSLVGSKGDPGPTGSKGDPGVDGREVVFQISDTHIQWKYVGETTWNNLIALVEMSIPGEDGLSAYAIYKKYYPNYNKSESEWLNDLLNGNLSTSDTFTVEFHCSDNNSITKEVLKGGYIDDIPVLSENGKVFLGWFTGNGINDGQFTKLTVVNKSLVLYPRWETIPKTDDPEEITISFEVNGGGSVSPISVQSGSALNLPQPEKDQYKFVGWYTSSDLTVPFSSNIAPNEDIKLYAKWRLYNIQEIKTLIDEFLDNINVRFKGKVIGYDSMGFAHIADETGAIYVRVTSSNPYQYLLDLGNTVEIQGVGYVYQGSLSFPEYTRQIKDDGIIITQLDEDIIVAAPVKLESSRLIDTAFDGLYNSDFHGNVVEVTGIVNTSNNKFAFYLLDDYGYPFVQIHHYSTNFQNTITDYNANKFLGLNGQRVTIKGIIYRLYETEEIWTIQSIGLDNQLIVHDEDELFNLHILIVNDLHGHIQQNEYYTNGISNMAYLIEEIRDQDPRDDVILLANGDMFQGTAISNMTYGRTVIEVMNMMNFDMMGIGNHEFDWGIEKIFNYFDGDESNGEANFPLVNTNIYYNDTDELLTNNKNVIEYLILEKEGVKVGIISYLGDVYSSISYDRVMDYYFDLNIALSVKSLATYLRDEEDVDIIVVNIHDGSMKSLSDYSVNNLLINLKDNNDEYLVDVIINGHTHQQQTMIYSRDDGSYVSLMQCGSNGYLFGDINLFINENKRIVYMENNYIYTSSAGRNYISSIENYIRNVEEDLGNETLIVAGETINHSSDLEAWVGQVMLAVTGTDIAICNTGGIRSAGNIKAGEEVTLSQLYLISPFDNLIWLMEIDYEDLLPLIYNSYLFYELANGVILKPGEKYTLSIITFVYYWDQLDSVRGSSDVDTGIFIRDALVEDLKQRHSLGMTFKPISNPKSSLPLLINSSYEDYYPRIINAIIGGRENVFFPIFF